MIPGWKEAFGKKSVREAAVERQKLAEYFMYQAYTALVAGKVIKERLAERAMLSLFEEVEMPLSLVLYDMEQEGIAVKREELKSYGEALTARI